MLIVAGDLTIAAEVRAQMLQAIAPHIADTRREDGCVLYSFSADPVEADRVLVVEVWESKEHLAAHLTGAAIGALGAAIAPFAPTGSSLMKYRVDAHAPFAGADGKLSLEFD